MRREDEESMRWSEGVCGDESTRKVREVRLPCSQAMYRKPVWEQG